MFRQGDWVTIKYGEYQGSYGKVSGIHRDGSAMVIPYSKDGEPGSMISLDGSGLELIEPLMVNREELNKLGMQLPKEIATDKVMKVLDNSIENIMSRFQKN